MNQYNLSFQASLKILLHLSKYPYSTCGGILVGFMNEFKEIFITDVFPLHHQNLTAPFLEFAFSLVEEYISSPEYFKDEKNKEIIGYYHADRLIQKVEFDFLTQKIADKLVTVNPAACIILMDNEKLSDTVEKTFKLYLKDVKRGWIYSKDSLVIESINGKKQLNEVFTEKLKAASQDNIVDFDEHLDDIQKDWRNKNNF